MTIVREELLAVLSDAAPAVARTPVIPELSHFWFDNDYLYAFDGGLGVRLNYSSSLDCGVPGRAVMDLLKTSSLKDVDVFQRDDNLVLQFGKAKVTLAALEGDRNPWPFPELKAKKPPVVLGTIKLTDDVLAAFGRLGFVRSKPTQVMHRGVLVVPVKGALEFYASDNASIAQMVVEETASKGLGKFMAPWEFIDRFLELVEPGSTLHVAEDFLMVEGKGVLVCSNKLDIEDIPDIAKTLDNALPEAGGVDLPPGLQAVLERASILAGHEEALVQFTVDKKSLVLEGKFKLGSLSETLPLKGPCPAASASFPAHIVKRGAGQVSSFMITDSVLILEDKDFVYVAATKYDPTQEKTTTKRKSPGKKKAADDDEIPF